MRIWSEYNCQYALSHKRHLDDWEFREVLGLLSPERGESILDVGCGTGEFCCLLKNKYEAEPYGIDGNEEAIKIARSLYSGISFDNVDVEKVKERKYDAVVMVEVIEHFRNPQYVLEILEKMLKPGGRIVVSTPNKWAVIHRMKSAIMGFDYLSDPLHFQHFNPKTLSCLFENTGFVIDNLYTKPLSVPFIRHINERLYYSIASGLFGTHIFLKAHKRHLT